MAVGGFVWAWSDPALIERAARAHLGLTEQTVTLTPRVFALMLLLSLIPLALFVYGMANVARLFHAFARGRVFALENAEAVARIGWTFVVSGLAASPLRTLLGLVLALDNLPGHRSLTVAFSLETLANVVTGVGLVAIAVVIREAVRLHDENRQFV
ncbi:DUF2975 domain-containing protein [Methylobacterium iners]|uniref:DUF2975 domain-containing protein n=1 Tax=Methylobacterium iners TaxID=418707 RepID=A0ABQ4S760_9HYPH|nr:DUF2975 domain-containing protein [Methylobacterium iners]GJD97602.1 hypothetical protein OCOJLMKI_4835 [Methylobacterium iners]